MGLKVKDCFVILPKLKVRAVRNIAKLVLGLVGVAGVALLVGFDPASLGPGAPVVIVLGLGAAFCYRIATFYAKTAKQQTG